MLGCVEQRVVGKKGTLFVGFAFECVVGKSEMMIPW